MLNRRHLRIKVLQSLYAFFQTENEDFGKAQKELTQSIERIYDLYLYLLLSFSELKAIGEHRIDENKKKIRPSEDEINPNLKFVNNAITSILENNSELRELSEKRKVNWVGDEHQEMFRKIYLQMRENETYFSHMNNDIEGFEEDKAFAIALFKADIANSEILYNFFEEKSIHWIDDIDLVCSMVIKTIKAFEIGGKNEILPLYKDKEDEVMFINDLFKKTIAFDKENELLIDDYTKNWELDRIAKMDVILMKMAITELQIFNSIPTKVTLNEYIEISKFYSTPKSNGFINGVLDNVISKLEKEGKINKVGRGLKN